MKALVTGAAGFIGSQYVRALLSGDLPGADDVRVTVLDKLAYSGNLENLADVTTRPGYEFVQGDICDVALVNEIGQALAKQLDFDAIVELVGERIRGLFDATTIALATYDKATRIISFPYTIDEGVRMLDRRSRPLGEGLNSRIIESKRPLLFGHGDEADAAGAITTGT